MQARDRPRAQPGERQLERHAFRRRDGDAILVLHRMNVDRFISEREGDWRELDGCCAPSAAARAGRAGRPAARRAVPRRGGRPRARAAPASRRSGRRCGWSRSSPARGRSSTRRSRGAGRCGRSSRGRTGCACASARRRCCSRSRCCSCRRRSPRRGRSPIPPPRSALIPGEFRGAVEPVGDTGMTTAQSTAFSSAVMTNNIQVTFLAFAAGIVLGLGTALVVAYNGLILGAVAGGAIGNGNGLGVRGVRHRARDHRAVVHRGRRGGGPADRLRDRRAGSADARAALVAEARPAVVDRPRHDPVGRSSRGSSRGS